MQVEQKRVKTSRNMYLPRDSRLRKCNKRARRKPGLLVALPDLLDGKRASGQRAEQIAFRAGQVEPGEPGAVKDNASPPSSIGRHKPAKR